MALKLSYVCILFNGGYFPSLFFPESVVDSGIRMKSSLKGSMTYTRPSTLQPKPEMREFFPFPFLSFLSSQISKHVSDSRYRAWPRVRQFLQDLEPGSIVCDVGKSAARALWSKWDSQSGTMANFMLCISSVCMYASLGVFKAG